MRAVVMGMVILGLAASAACHKLGGFQTKAAVQQAIEEHLKQQPNVFFQNMTVEVGDVTFNGDTAQALVKFSSKQAPNLAVGMLYKLRRKDNGWQVESTSTASMPGTSPHESTTAPAPPPSSAPDGVAPQPSH